MVVNNIFKQLITNYIILDKPNTRGWYPVLCKVCSDHGHKGKRAAFIFSDTGGSYHCFNCDHKARFDSTHTTRLSKELVELLTAFDIPQIEQNKLIFETLKSNSEYTKPVYNELDPPDINLPECFYPLTDNKQDEWCQYSIEYLTNRGIEWSTYPFYCVNNTNKKEDKKWYGRLIIPIYKNNKLIFYQGRDLTDLHQKKYLNANVQRNNILYGYDKILSYNPAPLYVTEGWFDAHMIEGVAVFGNKMTQQQITWLSKSNRPKVIIPDRYGDGQLLANQAIDLGWNVSVLDINDDCKDVNESIQRYGLLYTLKTIIDNTSTGYMSKILTNLYCTKGPI